MEDTGRRFSSSKLSSFCVTVLEKVGVSKENAELVAHSLLSANLRGVDTHGITRLPIYVERLQAGLTNGRAQGVVVTETPTTAIFDGQDGLGQVVGTKAMQLAIRKAESAGVGMVTVRNSTHYGTAGYYAMMALDKDMIGISLTNSPSLMAPWGGKKAFLGSNPIAIAVPAGQEKPFVLDMATTVVARGAIILAAKKGETIPITWGLNKDGEATTNAKEANEGALLPLGVTRASVSPWPSRSWWRRWPAGPSGLTSGSCTTIPHETKGWATSWVRSGSIASGRSRSSRRTWTP